jgi:hypothetical protein
MAASRLFDMPSATFLPQGTISPCEACRGKRTAYTAAIDIGRPDLSVAAIPFGGVASFGQTAKKSRALETRPAHLRNLRGELRVVGHPSLAALDCIAPLVELTRAAAQA